ncbi:MAG: hypothetical protein A3D56_01110 [Candidatus Taylorbacteria bacterium RIFCSPHIGHO2_02_FULL_45_35]|uniref:Peptidase M16 n=1 Tax=Candidatus Taylorbacteria bacterium RIFCSPHIGHO2_02_FULL_45_35 TaxID=1802311 RepID=A0A1G2MRJ1_9BACT|nr:MAG: hypothetical protein A3D56_01110 [Candidatus Taylorbacteria bacterium RIFCSPHIGHO2_02_FULL_45_35]OHA33787.1 MAG: hypothetical protein A3A22_00025 [Candidatus Taylorbacteria bacterium RIFCSPLOWO2_01_FULL_45_34b]
MRFERNILANGVRLITVPMKDNPTVTVLVIVEAGSKYETKELSGISHFLEHMCFKGTKRRPKAIDISRELDGIGSQSNAFTDQEFTGYFAKADKKHLASIVDVVADIYQNQSFPEAEIEKEKGVILEEINMNEDIPPRRVQDLFAELLYGDQPAGWDIAGRKETVSRFGKADLVEYKNNHYVSGATTVVVSGDFKEDEVKRLIEQHFSTIHMGKKSGKVAVLENQNAPAARVLFKESGQSHLVIGVRSFHVYDKRNPVLRTIATILGKGMSSRLFQRVREEMGACYYIGSSAEASSDHGAFAISAGVQHAKVSAVVSAIVEECTRTKEEGISEAELRKAKDFMIGNFYLGLESSDELAEFYGFQEAFRKELKRPREVVAEIEKVTADDVGLVAREIFQEKRLNVAIVGPFKDEKQFLPLLKF